MLMKNVSIINLPKILDARGNLSYIEQAVHIPFDIKRAYWIYDVPGGEERGGHAFKTQKEFIVALSGSFDVIINDGNKTERYHLNRSYYGLYISSGWWRHLDNFSTNSVVLVLSSTLYDANDYIRNFDEYLKFLSNEK